MAPFLQLRDWKLDDMDVMNFSEYGMNALLHLHKVSIEIDFLRGAASHWDPDHHIFRFGSHKLCPTIEEFHVLLGGPHRSPPVIPTPLKSPCKSLCKLLGLEFTEAKNLVRNNELNMRAITRRFQPLGDRLNLVYQEQRRGALCLCLLADYLLVSPDERIRTQLVDIVEQIKEQKSFIHMVLAETLVGLDRVQGSPNATFAGSPLLLQIWLMDKVALLGVPETPLHDPVTFINRRFIRIAENLEGWEIWFGSLGDNDIQWRCPWYDLPAMTINNMNFKRVAIIGLDGFTSYQPRLFPRQFGNIHDMPSLDDEEFFRPSFNAKSMRQYQCSWHQRELLQPI